MQEYIDRHGFDDRKSLIDYANALVVKYGGASGALACIMYEKTAEAENKAVKTAEMADLPSYGEVAKAVNGTMKTSKASVPSTVGRLTKQVGADTTLKNALRDGAQFAWIPSGDTCAFCITLASRGWQYASKKAIKNGHAEHIHSHCDCQYAIRFNSSTNVAGYDPDKYLQMYEEATGTPKEKINEMRRKLYAEKNGLEVDDEGYAIKKNNKNNDISATQEKIKNTDFELDKLKAEFLKQANGYSYEEWYNDFDSIADGFDGDTEDPDYVRLSAVENKIKEAEQSRRNLLEEKPKCAQIETGYSGKVPNDELNAFNEKCLQHIKADTGLGKDEAKLVHDCLKEYFGGDHEEILGGKSGKSTIISHAIDLMPTYEGSVYRGLTLSQEEATSFLNMEAGDTIPKKSNLSSWSSDSRVAGSFGGLSDYERTSIILECDDNKTGVGVQHLSKFGTKEAEVLSNANYEVVDIQIENKYDYLKTHKEYLYFEDDLETMSKELKENVVCKIKVREIS